VADAACPLPHPHRPGGAARAIHRCDTLHCPGHSIRENSRPSAASLLRSAEVPDHIQVVYLRGSAGKVDVYSDKGQGTLKIHCQWLDFACMHHQSFCRSWSPTDLANTNAPFFCCPVVEELLVRSIASMFKAHPTARPAKMKCMRQIGRRLRYLPHSIQLM
jgi:hypothetical protein